MTGGSVPTNPSPLPVAGNEALRLLDANLNRAREALRTLEDVARFILNDSRLNADLKDARHALRDLTAAAGLDAAALTAWRDTPGDVGTPLTTRSEQTRATTADIAIAAGKRAGEALRAIEESLKLLHQPGEHAAAHAKNLRYRIYDLEKRVTQALGTGRARQWRLCVLISESLCTHMPWERVAESTLRGGADCLQLREKSLDSGEFLARARKLADMTRAAGASLIINDRPDIALLSGADGVHVGQTDLNVADVRKLAGTRLLVGVSTTNMAQARRAAADGADNCGCGPMFATTTKHKPDLAGSTYLREYLADPQTARLPHLAIGGISIENIAELRRAGCRGVAVSSAVCGSPDPESVCRALISALEQK